MSDSNLKCFSINVRSLKSVKSSSNELLSLKSFIKLNNPDILAITETWLDNSIIDDELVCDNYICF